MKILGIGNAIVDVICKVDESFITENQLTKSTMKLIFDENEFKKLLSNLKIEKTVSGGSVANSIVGLSQLGNKVGFIGKVNDDNLGIKYEEGLKKENVEYFYSKKKEELPTGTCLILVTPDSERTMCTFLGTAGKISANDIQITIQGQTISSNFGTQESSQFNLEQLLSSGIQNQVLEGSRITLNNDDRATLEKLAVSSYEKYKAFKSHPKFVPYIEHMSTLKFYAKTNIGSRPSKRGNAEGLNFSDLRAIPFVGSWSQSKQNVPCF